MEGKSVKESSVFITQLMTQQDVNIAGNVHGGVITMLVDTAAGIVALRHTRMNVVTASIDRLDFLNPVYIGDLATAKASLNYVGKTSMEVGVYVQSENLRTGEIRHTASAYLTYVALDEDGRPIPVPPLIPETEDEVRRNREAQDRRKLRLLQRKKSE